MLEKLNSPLSGDVVKSDLANLNSFLKKKKPELIPFLNSNWIGLHIQPHNMVKRKNPFPLEELATLKTATYGVNPENLQLPTMITDEVKKYRVLDENSLIRQ